MTATTQDSKVEIFDASLAFRPEKKKEDFRNYTDSGANFDRVRELYREMHSNQSVDFVRKKLKQYQTFDRAEMTIMDAVKLLDNLVDQSDPDADLPNSVHAFQTAERIREIHPDKDWFQLTGLIHDLGKALAFFGEPQWAVVGDTFPVGCEYSDKIVFGPDSFKDNPDFKNSMYTTKNGVYQEKCGMHNLLVSFGHDEYLYQVLKNHSKCTLPEEAYYMVRFHSLYPWHTGNAYMQFCTEDDLKMLEWIREFNKFDLYSKSDEVPDPEKVAPYYQELIDKYIPGKLKW